MLLTQREQEILRLIEEDPMIQQQEIADKLGIARSSVAVHISNLTKKGYIAGKGYVLRSGSYAVVVGGVNVDIGGRSFAPLIGADSNPGTVSVSLGGVGRNIAHNLSLLGADVRLLAAYGDDLHGQQVVSSCASLGIDLSHALKVPGGTTSTYLYLTDEQGEMALAVSDMAVCDRITPEYLAANLPLLQGARVVVADANIPAKSLAWLAEHCTAPLFIDPVSTAKAEKLRPILSGIHTLKPNALEAALLSGVDPDAPDAVEQAAEILLKKGVKRLFISMGARGVYVAEGDTRFHLPNLPGRMVNTTGCGDAFSAALAWAHTEGLELKEAALAGLAAGSIAIETQETINGSMSREAVRARANI